MKDDCPEGVVGSEGHHTKGCSKDSRMIYHLSKSGKFQINAPGRKERGLGLHESNIKGLSNGYPKIYHSELTKSSVLT